MPIFVIFIWEIPVWLMVLAGLSLAGIYWYGYIPIICAILTFLTSLVSISSPISAILEENKVQLVGKKKVSRWVRTILYSFIMSSIMFVEMQKQIQTDDDDSLAHIFDFIVVGVNNIPVFIGISIFGWAVGKLYGDKLILKEKDPQEPNQRKKVKKDYLLIMLAIIALLFCISLGWD